MGGFLTKILRRKDRKCKYDLCAKASTYGFPTESSDNIDRKLSGTSGSSSSEKTPSIINDYKDNSHPQPQLTQFTLYQHSGTNLSTSSQLLAEINNERKRREARKLKMQMESDAANATWPVEGKAMDDSQDNENDKSIQSNQSLVIESSPSPPKTVPPFINLEKIANGRRSQAKSIDNFNLSELGEEECHIRGIVKPKFMTIRKGSPAIVSSSLLNNECEW